ncbi:hypothetical protein P3L51_24430 [Streptomyces sp. PSRA5]|uniref:hypothetical protein n=1 Tax=Streptomyces panacea TaxID=3035064 RepID=UPI00339CAA0C
MASAMTFVLAARDLASDTMDDIGDAATRMGRRLTIAAIQSDTAMRRLGRTTTARMAAFRSDTTSGAKAAEALKASLISLAPAAIPAAASLAPIAAGAGAAAVAIGVYGAALGPQIAAMGEAAEAEKAYKDAVEESGRTSQQAVAAQIKYSAAMAKLPPATRLAAAGMSVLKDEYKDWSDSLAGDTMGPVNKGLAIFGALLPTTTGLVKGTSTELDRMMTIAGGAMSTPGFDRAAAKFEGFAVGTLRKVNDGLLALAGSDVEVGSNAAEFMDYAAAQGPVVKSTLLAIGEALFHLLQAGSEVGVGMLQVVNILARLVSAVPPGAIALMFQLAIAIKLVRLAALGLAAARTAVAGFGASLVAMQTAAAGATGRMATLTAMFGTLSKTAKLALIGTGIGLLVVALGSLMQMGQKAPPDVDRITTSLGKLATTGKVSGEAARVYGRDLGGLADSLRELARPSNAAGIQQWATQLIGMDSTPVKEAKKDLDGIDKALASMVQSGNADQARAAFDKVAAAMKKKGLSARELKAELGDYEAALATAALEEQLAAQSMGLFGAQAQAAQRKLAEAKASTDGLRQSIIALNEVQRQGLGGMIGFEAAIDSAAKAAKENAGALKMVGGQLDLNSPKSQAAATALNDLAAKTDEAAASTRQSTGSWAAANAVYDRGRAKLIASAMAMGLTRGEAVKLAGQILKTPDKTARLKGNLEDLKAKLADAKARLNNAPSSKTAKLKGEISDLQRKIASAKSAIAGVKGKTVSITVQYRSSHSSASDFAKSIGGFATGGPVGFPAGGPVRGPGTGTSDSILARLSNGEYVIPADRVSQLGVGFFDAIRNGKVGRAKPVPTSTSAGRPVSSGGGAGQSVTNINIKVEGALDPVAVGRQLQQVLLNLKRTQGINVNLGVG